jgi:hypothetical protein
MCEILPVALVCGEWRLSDHATCGMKRWCNAHADSDECTDDCGKSRSELVTVGEGHNTSFQIAPFGSGLF